MIGNGAGDIEDIVDNEEAMLMIMIVRMVLLEASGMNVVDVVFGFVVVADVI